MPTVKGMTPKVENEVFTIWSTGKKGIKVPGGRENIPTPAPPVRYGLNSEP